jgi:hypothetical protein
MTKVTKWLVWAAAGPVLYCTLALPSPAQSSQIQMLHGHCERSAVHRLPCLPPEEFHSTSPDSFAVWADSSGFYTWPVCDSQATSRDWALVVASVFADSVYFRQEVGVNASNVVTSDCRVDAQVYFRVAAGQPFGYAYGGTLEADDLGVVGSYGVASVALSRIDPGGGDHNPRR